MAKSFNAQMQDRFKKITTDYGSINTYVHETAVMIVEHTMAHNDCSTAQGLVMAMPASARREMLILWFTKNTPIVVKNSDDWAAKMHKADSKLYVPFNLDAAKAKPFYELARENKERAPLDFAALVALPGKQAKRLETLIEEGKIEGDELETARALIAAFKAIKVAHVNKPEAPANDEDAAAAMAAAAA